MISSRFFRVLNTILSLRWGVDDNKTVRLCAVFTGIFAGYLGLFLYVEVRRPVPYPFGDFFAIWSYARIMLTYPAAALYDPVVLHVAQVAMGMPAGDQNPFPYPPTFLLMLRPLASLSFYWAFAIWVCVTFGLYFCASFVKGRASWLLAMTTLLAPTTTISIAAGQSGFLSASLLIGGLRLIDTRPVVSGILFGLLTYKPQLGIMVPVALVAAGNWRAIASACATVTALIAVTSLAYGWTIWATWIGCLSDYATWFDSRMAINHYEMGGYTPTVMANLLRLGLPPETARTCQALVIVIAAGFTWYAIRRFPRGLAIPAVVASTCLALPHAFIYDWPMMTSAVVLYAAYRMQYQTFRLLEAVALILVLTSPAILHLSITYYPLPGIILVPALFGLVILAAGHAAAARPRSDRPDRQYSAA